MSNNLRPPSSINDVRTQAHMALSARLEDLDLTQLLIYTLGSNVPDSILPYLIWQFDMMVPAVAMQALGATPLQILQAALPLHRIMGTPAAIKQALALCGFDDVTILEGQASWGGTSWPASQGWAVFRVNIPGIEAGVVFSQAAVGALNGINRTYTVPAIPAGSSLRVFYNGLLQRPGTDFTATGDDVIMAFAPVSTDRIATTLRTTPATVISTYIDTVINFFKAARCYLDSVTSTYPAFFDAVVPTISGSTLTLPQHPTSLELYRNGDFLIPGVGQDYTVSGNVVTLAVAPVGSDKFIAWGTYEGTGTAPAFYDYIVPSGAINGTNAVFTLSQIPVPAASLRLYLNSVLVTAGIDYTLAGATITYTSPPPSGSTHTAFFRG